jgi:hypothetical protein
MTLRRADWLLATLNEREGELRAQQAFFWGDESLDAVALHNKFQEHRRAALRFQVGNSSG